MKISKILFSAILFLMLGCFSNNGSGSAGTRILSKMDIAGASNLFIAPSSSLTKSGASVNKLFKVTEDGYVQEVTYTVEDEKGNPVSSTETLSPTSMALLNNDYLIIAFRKNYNYNYDGPGSESDNYLVSIGTGACYIYTADIPLCVLTNYIPSPHAGQNIETDNNGNIYFVALSFSSMSTSPRYSLKKLSVTDIDNVTITTVSAATDDVDKFGVDIDGNIAYGGRDLSNSNVLRYIKSSGEIENLSGTSPLFWRGFNGKLYYYNGSNLSNSIKELIANPFTVLDYGSNASFSMYVDSEARLLKIKNKDRIIVHNSIYSNYFDAGGSGTNVSPIYEVYNGITHEPSVIADYSTFSLASVKCSIASDDYYYIAGTSSGGTPKNVLVRVDPADNSYTTLIDGGYDIYKMTVDSNDVITFSALRMSDGAIVMGEVSSLGNITVLDATLTAEVVVLERIK